MERANESMRELVNFSKFVDIMGIRQKKPSLQLQLIHLSDM